MSTLPKKLELSPLFEKGCAGHSVLVYDESSYLVNSVAEYIRLGLADNEGILLIVRSRQWRNIRHTLNLPEARWASLYARKQVLFIDAQAIFESFFAGRPFEIDEWNELIGGAIASMQGHFPRVRCYSEQSNLLVDRGLATEAKLLEDAWNHLLQTKIDVSVLCAYHEGCGSACGLKTDEIVQRHAEHIKLESYDGPDSQAVLNQKIAFLEQRSLAYKSKALEAKKFQNELQLAKQELIQVSKLHNLGELCASIVHELNQPLTIMKGGIEQALIALKREGENSSQDLKEVERWLTSLNDASHRMIKIVKNVLDFANQQPRELKPISVKAALAKAMELMRGNLAIASVQVQLEIEAANELNSFGDEDLLVQVFINILSNARDALAAVKGVKTIKVKCGVALGEIIVTVSDNGGGMDETVRNKIFNPFFTTKSAGTGTGLGLSISQGIISQHKGRISCDSKPGIGTTFTISLPSYTAAVSTAA